VLTSIDESGRKVDDPCLMKNDYEFLDEPSQPSLPAHISERVRGDQAKNEPVGFFFISRDWMKIRQEQLHLANRAGWSFFHFLSYLHDPPEFFTRSALLSVFISDVKIRYFIKTHVVKVG
jgi:hypothetical protein